MKGVKLISDCEDSENMPQIKVCLHLLGRAKSVPQRIKKDETYWIIALYDRISTKDLNPKCLHLLRNKSFII